MQGTQTNNETKEFDYQYFLERLTLLRDGLIKNGENNEFTDKMSKWIDNIESFDTIKDISLNMSYKIDPRFDYYDTTPMFSYLTRFWMSGEHNKKHLYAFFPKKDERKEMQKLIVDIKSKATQGISLIEKYQEQFDNIQKWLSTTLRGLYDKMLRINNFDRQTAANICRLSLHTAEIEVLKEIENYFDEKTNKDTLEYILDFSNYFILQNHWGDLHKAIEEICNKAKKIVEEYSNIDKNNL